MHFTESGVKICIFLSLESEDAFYSVLSQKMHFPESGIKRWRVISIS